MSTLEAQIENKFFRSKHARLFPVFLKLHQSILSLGEDVSPFLSTVYVRYNNEQEILAVVYVRSGGFLEVGLALPKTIQSDRLSDARKLGWKQLTKSLKVESEADLDGEVIEWLKTAYQQG